MTLQTHPRFYETKNFGKKHKLLSSSLCNFLRLFPSSAFLRIRLSNTSTVCYSITEATIWDRTWENKRFWTKW